MNAGFRPKRPSAAIPACFSPQEIYGGIKLHTLKEVHELTYAEGLTALGFEHATKGIWSEDAEEKKNWLAKQMRYCPKIYISHVAIVGYHFSRKRRICYSRYWALFRFYLPAFVWRFQDGRTPLHWAAAGGHHALVEYLVGFGWRL